jgi:hypothetical protein
VATISCLPNLFKPDTLIINGGTRNKTYIDRYAQTNSGKNGTSSSEST